MGRKIIVSKIKHPVAVGDESGTPLREYDPPLDKGILRAVEILNQFGIETFESCEGGPGHAYPEPTVRFHGQREEVFKALSICLQHNLPVSSIRRIWPVIDGEPVGPYGEIVFWKKLD
jgi:hypothetical protein